jgi:Uma2 family endonuclease
MALPRSFTVADLYAMPEGVRGERYELIDGDLFVTPAPASRHQVVSSNLFFHLSAHVRSLRLGWVGDNTGVHLDERTYVIPDLVFICRERQEIIGEANIEAAPDLVVEILSPSTRRNDLLIKRSLYARIGVREYWIIEPAIQGVTVLTLESGNYIEVPPPEPGAIRSRVLPDLRQTRENVFEAVDSAPTGSGAA